MRRAVDRDGALGVDQTVFIVDDDPAMRSALSDYLSLHGFATETFDDPAAFLAMAGTGPAGCVVLDIQMATLDGLDVQQALVSAKSHLPIIFVTGQADIAMTVVAMKAGAHDFLTKPFDGPELLNAVTSALSRERQARSDRARLDELAAGYASLTDREREIMIQAVGGRLNKTIAAALGLSEITVKVSRRELMRKMGATSIQDLVKISEALKAIDE